METIAHLDEQLSRLSNLARSSARAMDQLVEVSDGIAVKTSRIQADCTQWQTAQNNVASTVVEAVAASRCYHTPSYVPAVLSRKDRDPRTIAKVIEYCAFVASYISTHQPNDETVLNRAERRLERLDQIVSEEVRDCLLAGMGMLERGRGTRVRHRHRMQDTIRGNLFSPREQTVTFAAAAPSSGMDELRLQCFPNRRALNGLGELVRRSFHVFDKSQLLSEDIPNLLLTKVRSLMDPLFDSHYMEEFEPAAAHIELPAGSSPAYLPRNLQGDDPGPPVITNTTRRGGRQRERDRTGGVSRGHYHKGEHALLQYSRAARQMVLELSEVVQQVLLGPLEFDPLVSDVPGQLATAVFTALIRHARQSIYLPQALLDADPTIVFLITGGTGYELASIENSRTISDALFIGLDLMEELWQWKSDVGKKLAGDHIAFDQTVEEELHEYCDAVRIILDKCRDCRGRLRGDILLRDDELRQKGDSRGLAVVLGGGNSSFGHADPISAAMLSGRRCWFPSFDCSTHESTVHLMYLLRTLFGKYYGVLKLVLLDGNAEAEACEALSAVEEYMLDCITGHLDDIKTIALISLDLQRLSEASSESVTGKKASGTSKVVVPGAVRVSPALFVLNNVYFMSENLEQPAFTNRTRPIVVEVEVTRPAMSSLLDAQNTLPILMRSATSAVATGTTTTASRTSAVVEEGCEEPAPPTTAPSTQALAVRKRRKVVYVRLVESSIETLKAEINPLIDDYEESWDDVFPPFDDPEDTPPEIYALYQASAEELPRLNKEQRQCLKIHHQLLQQRLTNHIEQARVQVANNPMIKTELTGRAVRAVEKGFERLEEELVKGRVWSRHDDRWIGKSVAEWLAEVENIL